jgi:hypothetical protein
VARLITRLDPDAFLTLGDLQYNNGKLSEFMKAYDPQFGHLNDITFPTPGNHEYGTEGAQDTSTILEFGLTVHWAAIPSTSVRGTWS